MTPPDLPGAPGSVGALPVLTEVVDWPVSTDTQASAESAPADEQWPASAPQEAGRPGPLLVEDARAIEEAVLAELQQRIDLMFEYRLRETLAPTLARVTDLLIREAREEVALTLRDVVSRAVAQEIGRRRQRR